MNLNETEINNYLQPFFGQYKDSFQEAWVDILECNPQALEEITPIIRRVRNKAIRQYLNKKYREESLYKPIGKNGDEKFTLESILESPGNEDSEDRDNGDNGLYKKIVDFLIGEYFKQKNENLELKRRDVELKAERLRLRREWLEFKKDRFESWKKLMEDKGKQKENQFKLEIQLKREKLEFRREQVYLKEKKRTDGEKGFKRILKEREDIRGFMKTRRQAEFVPAKAHAKLTTGEVIRMLRELKGWTQAELARVSGISPTNISLLENEKVKIGKKRVEQLAKAFDIHPAIIMFPEYEAKEIQKAA